MELENQQITSKKENLEKKVESLMQFLENERRLRHEMEDQVKQHELREKDAIAHLNAFKAKAEKIEEKEVTLKRQIDGLIQEQRAGGQHTQDAAKKVEQINDENRELRGKVEFLASKVTNLERENTKLYQQLNYQIQPSQLGQSQNLPQNPLLQTQGFQQQVYQVQHPQRSYSPLRTALHQTVTASGANNSPRIGNYSRERQAIKFHEQQQPFENIKRDLLQSSGKIS